MADFSEISDKYEKDSLVQKSAGEILMDMLAIKSSDNVLDLGCGTGHLTKLIREKTRGKVVGVDPSEGMIKKATEKYAGDNILFFNLAVEQLDFDNEFDSIFCNSAFQWFTNPASALAACHNCLKNNGKIAIQAPAQSNYCPNFLAAVENVKGDQATREIFAEFSAPWFFLESADEYARLFADAGFTVSKSTIDRVSSFHSAEEVFKIFESGAAAGYLNQKFYRGKLPSNYADSFRDLVRKSFVNQADETGQVELIFSRIYLLAVKEDNRGRPENL